MKIDYWVSPTIIGLLVHVYTIVGLKSQILGFLIVGLRPRIIIQLIVALSVRVYGQSSWNWI